MPKDNTPMRKTILPNRDPYYSDRPMFISSYGGGYSGYQAHYTFKHPNMSRNYMQILDFIANANNAGRQPTRREIQVEMGMPDPKSAEHPNWGQERFQALRQAGLVKVTKIGRSLGYTVTPVGHALIAEAKANSANV